MSATTPDPATDDRYSPADDDGTDGRSGGAFTASRARPHVDTAAERAHGTIDSLGQRARAGVDTGHARAEAAIDAADQFERQALDAIDDTAEKLTRYVREKPLQAAGIAFAAGVVTALLLRRG